MECRAWSYHWFASSGSHFDTMEINFPPGQNLAEVSLHGVVGGGMLHAGIIHYRRRLESGADEDVHLGRAGEFEVGPPVIYDFISSVTFAIRTGGYEIGWVLARIYNWV
jgi:hypothetical protein